jgi:uncharacterized repeat protein (TIGR01451 family)
MQKLIFNTLVAACLLLHFTAAAQNINIPDARFKSALVSSLCVDTNDDGNGDADADTNNDSQISVAEALAVTRLDVKNRSIDSLAGIQYFTNLQTLNCSSNDLTYLNILGLTNLQTLHCNNNQISILNMQGLTNLQTLHCESNGLANLNVQGLTNLQTLYCNSNQLPTLNIQVLTSLQILHCNSNRLTALNLQGLTNLQTLNGNNNLFTALDAQGLTNLQYLYCNSNSLSSLNVQGLTNLQTLHCWGNQLTTLNAQGLTSLQALWCNNNRLTSLNVQGCANLLSLGCNNNQLTTLDVQGLVSLQYLHCFENQLTSLSVQDLTNLQILYCNNNQLTSLNMRNLTNLLRLDCQYNQLTTLDVQGFTNLQNIQCQDNQLTTLFIKNLVNESIDFYHNPNIAYICCDESEITSIQNIATSFSYPNCNINSYCSFAPGGAFYTLHGQNILDINNNGCAANDSAYTNLKYTINGGVNSGVFIASASGSYTMPLQIGSYIITPVFENTTYFTASPSSLSLNLPQDSLNLNQNFCITPNGTHHDVELTIIPVTPARPGFDATYQIVYKNKGTAVESDSISFRFDDARVDFVSASVAPSSQRTNFLVWQYSNLQPFETRTITVTLNVNSPMETPAVNAGDVLVVQAVAYPLTTDEIPSDNGFGMRQIVVGSLDPNDKTCLEGDKITPDMIGQYLHYVIRFENTGTYAAENIVVHDMIDAIKFDMASLQMTKASHDCRTRIKGNKVEFIFENINLPFTAPDKYGFVAFKIKTKPNLVLSDAVTNQADIFFDYNFPIRTNTASTEVVAALNPSEGGKPNSIVVDIVPNPVTDILNLKTDILIQKAEVYDNLGRLVQASGIDNNTINISTLPNGLYFIKLYAKEGVSMQKVVKE